MALVMMHPFEGGDALEAISLAGTFDAGYTGWSHSGTYSLRINPVGASGTCRFGGNDATGALAELGLTTGYFGGAFRLVNTDGGFFLAVSNSANGMMARWAYVEADGGLQAAYSDATDTNTPVGSVYPMADGEVVWWEIGITNAGTPGGATIEWRINGVVHTSISGVTMRSASRTLDRVNVTTGAGMTCDVQVDDLYADDAAYQGEIGAERLAPDAAGSEAEWTTGTGATFAEVDDNPSNDGDTTYIATSTNNRQSTFNMTATSVAVVDGQIRGVKAVAVIRDEGGAAAIQVRIRSGATSSDTTSRDPGATYVASAKIDTLDPATAAAWTKAAVDAIEIGVDCAASVAARCTKLHAAVIYAFPVAAGQGLLLAQQRNHLVRTA